MIKDIIVFWISLAIVVLTLFAFPGCAAKTVYVDRVVEIKVPVKCQIKAVETAKSGVNDAVTLADIIRERDELKEAMEACK